jgi:hypothetical protein
MRREIRPSLAAAALLACACAGPGGAPPRAVLMEEAVGAGAQIYPQVLAHAVAPEHAVARAETSARPQRVYLSRSLCPGGEPAAALRLGPELQDALTRSAREQGLEVRWADSQAVFEHAEVADSGDVLVCFGPIELDDVGARVDVSLASRDGSREAAAYAFRLRDGRWLLDSESDAAAGVR